MKKINKSSRLSDQAFEILKESILVGELKGGDPLPEEKYSKQLGISRTPFRDTLTRLASEGLIIQRNGAPAVVADFTKEMSLEHMELRNILEVYNIEKVLLKIDSKMLESLKKNLEMQERAIEENRYSEFMQLDKEFHLSLVSINANNEIKKIIQRVNDDLSRAFLILSKTVPQSAQEAQEEHGEIIKAIEMRDTVLAKNKMIVHLNNVEKRFLNYYQAKEDEDSN
ncbi:GntR family transcriptional regulator [Salinicoccus roseus]|uniref:GntR family transcriptional regulator n=1 Tax=Salinicoccus roseus TaxID=45670 RepID=UPI0023009827|nr:GntR family transcriptional regulator [Salinicoccus roseus]